MIPFIIPLLCAVLYPLGTLLVKRSLEKGVDTWSLTVINYWMMALVFLPVWFLEARPIPWDLWYQPLCMGLFSFLGQAFAFKAISSGDLTIATPALSSKVLIVALFTVTLLHQSVPLPWWIAAVCSFAAVFFLQAGVKTARRKVFTTLFFSLLTAACFAMGDVLIQKWSPRWGVFHFVPAFAAVSAAYSLALIPLMRKPRLAFSPGAWKWLLAGTGALSLQSLGLTAVIGMFGKATQANIVFSSRGLWNFLLIWFGGHWFANRERDAGSGVMRYRLAGAALMFAAIVLASLR
jgi:drug/metabolite transporter (DMT)-like permease